MDIAEFPQVRALFPDVAAEAVEHLLWALHRVRPLIEAGNTADAFQRFRTDLAAYEGATEDIARLGALPLLRGLERGRLAFADTLGGAGLLAPSNQAVKRYVVVGPLLDVRVWARRRGIGLNTVISVCRAGDTFKLRGLSGDGLAIVRLADRRGDPTVEDLLSVLLQRGAITLAAHWAPGAPADPGEPRLDLRAHRPPATA